jgi:hypothetical protein
MRYDDSDDGIWQRGHELKAYLMWDWNSLNSQSFIFVRGEGRERRAGKSTIYSDKLLDAGKKPDTYIKGPG